MHDMHCFMTYKAKKFDIQLISKTIRTHNAGQTVGYLNQAAFLTNTAWYMDSNIHSLLPPDYNTYLDYFDPVF